MLVDDKLLHLLADAEFYEPMEQYRANAADYVNVVRRILPRGWRIGRSGVWAHCQPPEATLPLQGWKIHLSATDGNSAAVLATVARLLAPCGVPFKFAADRRLLYQLTSKRWPRGGSGKFITVYPSGTEQCAELLETLYREMVGYQGPYILSDRRYRDSGVVYYRYGGIAPVRVMDVRGRRAPVMQAADGSTIPDERAPYFRLPEGVRDPFVPAGERDGGGDAGTLKEGRYAIESVITFSNSGGVYVALDRESGERVLVKEARPHTSQTPRGTDAVWMLKKEHRLLRVLEDARVAPRPIDFFQDWEHFYLVEELLDGMVLRSSNTMYALTLRTRPTRDDAEAFYARFRRLHGRIADALAAVHERGIVFGDVSLYNVMVLKEGDDEVRLIDFEGAFEEGVDPPNLLFTPGFAPAQMIEEGVARREDDRYGLGGLMLAALMPVNSMLGLNPRAHEPFLDSLERDLGLPPQLSSLIRALLDPARERRPGPEEVREALRADHPVGDPQVGTHEAEREPLDALLARVVAYIESSATFDRHDRLFPADAEVFETNPLGVAHGACGVALALQRATGRLPAGVAEWILDHPLAPDTYPPGLYAGLAGVAWTLLELGFRDEAEKAMAMACGHPLRHDSPDLYYGAAGWGMAALRFFLSTGDEAYRARAEEAGAFLLESRREEDGACWWTTPHDGVSCSLAHGAAGVSLFLLYLHLATGDERYADAGRRALAFVASKALRNQDGGLTWRAREHEPTHTPYWRWGSTGIGMAALRYRRALGEDTWDAMLDDLLLDADRKYTIFPGRFFGLAGIGDFFLDLAELGDDRDVALRGARKALSGLLLFGLERPEGLAFPGESLARISCDFGTGSAGIAFFLHRLIAGGGPAFMLDELLEPRARVLPFRALRSDVFGLQPVAGGV